MILNNEYGTGQIQEELLNYMVDFHEFCLKNDIQYSLCGGTLLGAIRHNGFIPWDDDMDIMLDRDNFNKLIQCIKQLNGYVVKRKLWIYRVQKIEMLENENIPTIDLFVMDNVPKSVIIKKLKIFMIKVLQGMMKEKPDYKKYSCINKFLVALTYNFGNLFTDEFKYMMYEKISQIGNKEEAEYVTAYNDLFKLLNVCYDKETVSSFMLHKFEDKEFYITKKWDSYLTKQYGDYMTPPKNEDRVPQHISRGEP